MTSTTVTATDFLCGGTYAPCANSCTTGCVNGQYAQPVTYEDGRVDYITVNCACGGRICLMCEVEDEGEEEFYNDCFD